jgi:DNA repair ATPase RecN
MNSELSNKLPTLRSNLETIAKRLEYESQQVARAKNKLEAVEKDKTLLVKAVGVIDKCIQIISANGIGKIESIVTAGLRLVFKDESWKFVVEKKETARGNSYRLIPYHGETKGPAMDTFGGGVVNVITFLLRLIMVRRFKLAKFMAIDESMNNVSLAYLPRVSEMLKKLCKDHGFDILAITHQPILAQAADTAYQAGIVDGNPTIRRMDPAELLA